MKVPFFRAAIIDICPLSSIDIGATQELDKELATEKKTLIDIHSKVDNLAGTLFYGIRFLRTNNYSQIKQIETLPG